MPPNFIALGKEAIEAARTVFPAGMLDDFTIDTVVVNRYAKKRGVGPHHDPVEMWKPIVLGVTLYEDIYGRVSFMQFASDNLIERFDIPTPHRSVYVFYGAAYTNATHSRKQGKSDQKGMIYSFTFRSEKC